MPSNTQYMEWLSPTLLWFHNGANSIMEFDFAANTVNIRGTFQVGTTTLTANALALIAQGVAGGYKLARGQYTTVSASDTVVTGLTTIVAAVCQMESDPVLTVDRATVQIGNQSGAPVAGSIIVKTWMPTGAALTTPIAAITFGKLVNWVAIGT